MKKNRTASSEILWRLATNLKRLRKARGYTQHELACRCGFSPGYIGDVEREVVNLSLANLENLALGLDCSEYDLLLPIRPGQR
jgi:transcriptional regulator with XRE-family HTH domain